MPQGSLGVGGVEGRALPELWGKLQRQLWSLARGLLGGRGGGGVGGVEGGRMQLEILILSEISQKEKKNTVYDLYVESKMWPK